MYQVCPHPNSFPEKEGWDRLFALNVKSIFYSPSCHAFFRRSSLIQVGPPVTVGLTPLLAKDSTNHDPARVINISSIAAISPISTGTNVTGGENGVWSCQFSFLVAIILMKFSTRSQIMLAKPPVRDPHMPWW